MTTRRLTELTYLVGHEIRELILRQGYAGKDHQCEPQPSGASDCTTLHAEFSFAARPFGRTYCTFDASSNPISLTC